MTKTSGPPLDHLFPISWLLKAGVPEREIESWAASSILIKINGYGGSMLFAFSDNPRPVRFRELPGLIDSARKKSNEQNGL